MAGGRRRAALAVLATVAICALSLWSIAATQLGLPLGLNPWESLSRLGVHHAWTLVALATTPLDWAALLLAPPLAAWWAR